MGSSSRARRIGAEDISQALRPQGRPLLVNHWATWCDPCVEELPLLRELHARIGDRVDFVGVAWERFMYELSLEDALEAVDAASAEHALPWSSLVFDDTPEALFAALALEAQTVPQTHLFGADGALLHVHHGVVDAAALEAIAAFVS